MFGRLKDYYDKAIDYVKPFVGKEDKLKSLYNDIENKKRPLAEKKVIVNDKQYKDVMKDDALDLGIEAGPEGESGDKPGDVDTGSEDVTLTLSRDVAQKLHDLLHDVLGAEDEVSDSDEGSDEDEQHKAEDKKDEDEQHKAEDKKDEDEEVSGEATEIEELPDSKGQSLTGKNNKVPGKLGHAKSGKASGDATGGSDGKPVALPDSKGHSLTGKNNKVNAPGYKAGDFFK